MPKQYMILAFLPRTPKPITHTNEFGIVEVFNDIYKADERAEELENKYSELQARVISTDSVHI